MKIHLLLSVLTGILSPLPELVQTLMEELLSMLRVDAVTLFVLHILMEGNLFVLCAQYNGTVFLYLMIYSSVLKVMDWYFNCIIIIIQ